MNYYLEISMLFSYLFRQDLYCMLQSLLTCKLDINFIAREFSYLKCILNFTVIDSPNFICARRK